MLDGFSECLFDRGQKGKVESCYGIGRMKNSRCHCTLDQAARGSAAGTAPQGTVHKVKHRLRGCRMRLPFRYRRFPRDAF